MIPGMYPAFERENKESELEKKTKSIGMGVKSGIALLLIYGFVLYGAFAALQGSLYPKKWPEKQRKQQELIQQQSSYRKQFHELDKNKDYVIDSTEFIYRK